MRNLLGLSFCAILYLAKDASNKCRKMQTEIDFFIVMKIAEQISVDQKKKGKRRRTTKCAPCFCFEARKIVFFLIFLFFRTKIIL